ncbi:MAG TPA: glycosyltransferase family 4 protein, partial [Candidatus Goldiibacteriota bacterium]|nr:glycosyltransferase family 4 protein [Candidatus Goldiibacteriota bacterium]
RLRSAPFCSKSGVPAVIDIVDSMALLNTRRQEFERNPARLIYGFIDTPRLLSYERALEEEFGAVIVNSEDDASYLGISKIYALANGSDGKRRKTARRKNVFTAGFFGNMEYPPNMDAAVYFVKNVWKKHFGSDNNVRLILAGDRRGALKRLAGGNILIKGYVEDIDSEISSWDVSLVPVRYGAGRQNKIMKSWSCGVPVISSAFAAKGVYGRHGKNMMIAGKDEDYAAFIRRLMADLKLAKRIAAGGMAEVKRRFSWEKSGSMLEKILKKNAKGKK